MNYAEIKYFDIANGIGVRTSLFVSGCTRHCKDCFNEKTWDFNYGEPFTKEVEDDIIESLKPDYIDGLTILGGEPFEPANQKGVYELINRVRKEFSNSKTIWIYTGNILESDILNKDGRAYTDISNLIFSDIDILVDGPFIAEQKDISLRFRGSTNQRIIDVPKSLFAGEVALHDGYMNSKSISDTNKK